MSNELVRQMADAILKTVGKQNGKKQAKKERNIWKTTKRTRRIRWRICTVTVGQ